MLILIKGFQIILIGTIFVLAVQAGPGSTTVYIDTDLNQIKWNSNIIFGDKVAKRNFTCRNNFTWFYEVTRFRLKSDADHEIFASGTKVVINGSRALKIVTARSLVIDTVLDLSAVAMGMANSSRTMHLGGFVLNSTKCCYVGAGPGAAMTYHGGGHGGNGGGSWKDFNHDYLYGKQYLLMGHTIGGSTGAILYNSDPGTGGGAIKLKVDGQLTIGNNAKILTNGFSVHNTTYPACSGGSAGGRIVILSSQVMLSGELSADGGNSGITSNYSNYCGDGGGGGIIDIQAIDLKISSNSKVTVNGGRGLENGTNGLYRVTSFSADGQIVIDTTACFLEYNRLRKNGTLTDESTQIACRQVLYKVCNLHFSRSLVFPAKVTFEIAGENALKIVANGDITVNSSIDVSGQDLGGQDGKTFLGGYHGFQSSVDKGPGKDINNGAHGSSNNSLSYGISPLLLIGGSVCTNASLTPASGGGAISLHAQNGNIIINANITANGFTKDPTTGCGASGGTIILEAINIIVAQNAYVEARGSNGAEKGGDGGVIASSLPLPSGHANANPGNKGGNGGGNAHGHGKKGAVLASVDYSAGQSSSVCVTSSQIMPSSTRSIVHDQSFSPMRTSSSFSSLNSSNSQIKASSFSSLNSNNSQIKATTPTSATRYSPSSSVIRVQPEDNLVSPQLQPLLNATVTSGSAVKISRDLSTALESMSRMTTADMVLSMRILAGIANQSVYVPADITEAKAVSNSMVSSCNRIAKIAFKHNHNNRSSSVVPQLSGVLERYGQGIGIILKKNNTFLLQSEAITLEVTKVDTKISTERSFPVSPNLKFVSDNVTIPMELFPKNADNISVVLVMMNINETYNNSYTVATESIRVASNILSVLMSNQDGSSLAHPITLRHKLAVEVLENKEVKCGFWKKKVREDSSHGWSYRGCNSVRKNGFVETKCDHMTSFAVLMSVKQVEIADVHKTALSYITYIGCGISLFGLLLTFATFVTLDTLDAERTAIHTNLVVALGIAQVVYLAGINATNNKAACTSVAVMLHYFFTAAFSWMLAEGLHLYQKVVSVFSHGSKLKFYYVIGWGLPVIIVALAAGIRSDGYGNENACWISMDGGLIWAFVAPVLIVIIINFVVLVIVVKILISSVSTVQVDIKSDNKSAMQVKAGAKAMVILMPILGLSWVFGILAVNSSTLVFQYLFCIFNSLQGLFIFLIHCVGNNEVRSAFKRLHEKHTLSKSIGEKSSGPKSICKEDMGEEILVRRQTNSSLGSSYNGDRIVTPKTLSAGQISLNSLRSLHSPIPNEGYYDDET